MSLDLVLLFLTIHASRMKKNEDFFLGGDFLSTIGDAIPIMLVILNVANVSPPNH
jgi:hypothetical protein